MNKLISLAGLLAVVACHLVAGQERGFDNYNGNTGSNGNVLRAQAQTSLSDCLCQCSSRTFRDKRGKTHGNCRSADNSGAQWCYIRPISGRRYGYYGNNPCQDTQRSKRYYGINWSYHACATPALNSYTCRHLISNNNNYNGGGGGGGCVNGWRNGQRCGGSSNSGCNYPGCGGSGSTGGSNSGGGYPGSGGFGSTGGVYSVGTRLNNEDDAGNSFGNDAEEGPIDQNVPVIPGSDNYDANESVVF